MQQTLRIHLEICDRYQSLGLQTKKYQSKLASMRNRLVMQILQACEKLIHNILGFAFAKAVLCFSMTCDVGKEVATRAKLQKYMPEGQGGQGEEKMENLTNRNFPSTTTSITLLMFGWGMKISICADDCLRRNRHMIQGKKNLELFHDFYDFAFLLRLDTLASNLPVRLCIDCEVNGSKATTAKTV
jgi:hypothetical protein